MNDDLALNPTFVRKYIRFSDVKMQEIESSLISHYDSYKGYVAWSGGKDSTVIVDIARKLIPDIQIVSKPSE